VLVLVLWNVGVGGVLLVGNGEGSGSVVEFIVR
jgi:hypothetical protein